MLLEVRLVVRRGRTGGCRWASRSVLLTALVARSFVVGPQVPCSDWDHCRRSTGVQPVVLSFVAGAVHQVGP